MGREMEHETLKSLIRKYAIKDRALGKVIAERSELENKRAKLDEQLSELRTQIFEIECDDMLVMIDSKRVYRITACDDHIYQEDIIL